MDILNKKRTNNLTYLVIGPKQVGKTSLLAYSSLPLIKQQTHFTETCLSEHDDANPLSPKSIKEIEELEHAYEFNFWQSDSINFLDVPGEFVYTPSVARDDRELWPAFLTFIKKFSRKRSVTGVLLVIELEQLINTNYQEQRQFFKHLKSRLNDLGKKLKTQLPLHLLVNKSDRLAGFSEFFEDLGKDELGQPWGVWLTPGNNRHQSIDNFVDEFSDLLKKINDRLIWRMHQEHNEHRKVIIKDFPLQMESLKPALVKFMNTFNADLKEKYAPRLTSIHFTSAEQRGLPVDSLTRPIGKALAISTKSLVQSLPSISKPFFIRELFEHFATIQAEKFMQQGVMQKLWVRRMAYGVITCVTFGTVGMLAFSFNQGVKNIASAEQAIAEYNVLINHEYQHSMSLTKKLQQLDKLDQASLLLTAGDGSLLERLHILRTKKASALADKTYHKALRKDFLLLVSKYAEQALRKAATPEQMYAWLKAYLMLGMPQHLSSEFLLAWFDSNLADTSDYKVRAIHQHLSHLLHIGFDGISLDRRLIATVREKLNRLPEDHLAYLNFRFSGGMGVSRFDLPVRDHTLSLQVPTFFTMDHLASIKQSDVYQASQDALVGDWVIGVRSEVDPANWQIARLSNAVIQNYLVSYADAWQQALAQLTMSMPSRLADVDDMLGQLTKDDSPIDTLIGVVRKNTSLPPTSIERPIKAADFDNIVARVFQPLLRLSRINLTGSTVQHQLRAELTVLHRQIQAILHSDNPDKASFESVKFRFTHPEVDDALSRLAKLGASLPQPLAEWVTGLTNQAWQQMIQHAHVYINYLWREQVLSQYNLEINDRFPIFATSDADISLDKFTAFFGPEKLIATFHDNYIAPFVNTNQVKWTNKIIAGGSMDFSEAALEQIERALLISQMFYPDKNDTLDIRFSLQPSKFGQHTSGLHLNINGQTMRNRFNNPDKHTFHWPGKQNLDSVVLGMFGEREKEERITLSGPWALFRLLKAGHVHQISNSTERYQLRLALGNKRVALFLQTHHVFNPFIPKIIDRFRCPQQLTNTHA